MQELFSQFNFIQFESLKSVALFGSYSRGDYNTYSDIDILLLVENKNEISKIEKYCTDLNSKIECHFLTIEELKAYIYECNSQLITFFYDFKIIYDPSLIFRKAQNLFLGIHRKKHKSVRIKKQHITLQKLRAKRSFR